jgi:nucleoside recognition membrane protein YjiH
MERARRIRKSSLFILRTDPIKEKKSAVALTQEGQGPSTGRGCCLPVQLEERYDKVLKNSSTIELMNKCSGELIMMMVMIVIIIIIIITHTIIHYCNHHHPS